MIVKQKNMNAKTQTLYVDKIGRENDYKDIAWTILHSLPTLDDCNLQSVTDYIKNVFEHEASPIKVYLDNSLLHVQLSISIDKIVPSYSGAYTVSIEIA